MYKMNRVSRKGSVVGIVICVGILIGLSWGPGLVWAQPLEGGSLDPTTITKYASPLIIPPAMPRTGKVKQKMAKNADYYEIAVRQFDQQILPPGLPMTTVWSYGSVNHPGTFNYPAFTIEADWMKPVRVKWINDLKDPETGSYLSHLLPVDQTLHWANPPGGLAGRDMHGMDPNPYTGPVPMITHVHGAHVSEESDGYPEAWYLPDASDIPAWYATEGTYYATFEAEFDGKYDTVWEAGTATFQYPNDQRATTLWYHDHTLGMTRVNVYAGPAGFYLLRGGPDDDVFDIYGAPAVLPGPEPGLIMDPETQYHEIPIVIQDRSFDEDGSLWYPDNRAFFEDFREPEELQIPFAPDPGCDGLDSDVAPIWNPEFFGNTMVVNGRTWPFLNVEQCRYRFRLLNGCQSRFLILEFENALPFWQIGSEGGFLPAPVQLTQLLIGPAERADVIVDFAGVPAGTSLILLNLGPDEPFGGGVPGDDFPVADPGTTGQVMQFNVIPAMGPDMSTPPQDLVLPPIVPLGAESVTRQLSLNEAESANVYVIEDATGNIVLACEDPEAEPFGPTAAFLGTVEGGFGIPRTWMEEITENPDVGATEIWELHNFTMDAHPIHVHLVMFQVLDRGPMPGLPGAVRPPEAWETGWKDTVIAYPGEITRIKARFDLAGLYVWHCHILEHEDNEMMRPYRVGPNP